MIAAVLLPAVVFGLAQGATPKAGSISRAVLGASSSQRKQYRSKTWSCDGGRTKLGRDRVNDDYCDCKDGTDELGTSACSGIVDYHDGVQVDGSARAAVSIQPTAEEHQSPSGFFCTDTQVIVRILPSQVNDGVPDCCDASDEWLFSHYSGVDSGYENTCDALLLERRKELLSAAKLHEAGVAAQRARHGGNSLREAREVFNAYKAKNAEHWGQEMVQAQTKLKQVQEYLQKVMPPSVDKDGKKIPQRIDPMNLGPDTMRAMQYYQHMKQKLASIQYQYSQIQKIAESSLGPRLEFLPLLVTDPNSGGRVASAAPTADGSQAPKPVQIAPPCFRSAAINEKSLKGGTPNVIPQQYRFTFCPFRHVTQVEVNHTHWEISEKRAKQGLPVSAVKSPEEPSPLKDAEDDGVSQTSIFGHVMSSVRALFGSGSDEDIASPNGKRSSSDGHDSASSVDEETSETLVGVFVGWEEDLITQEAYRIGAGLPSRIPSSKSVTREEAEAAYAKAVSAMTEEAKSAGVAAAKLKSEWLNSQENFRPRTVMVFRDGHECAEGIGGVGKVPRSMRVRFECGEENVVLSVEEEGYCTYQLRFATPSSCSLQESRKIRGMLAALPKPLASSRSRSEEERVDAMPSRGRKEQRQQPQRKRKRKKKTRKKMKKKRA